MFKHYSEKFPIFIECCWNNNLEIFHKRSEFSFFSVWNFNILCKQMEKQKLKLSYDWLICKSKFGKAIILFLRQESNEIKCIKKQPQMKFLKKVVLLY